MATECIATRYMSDFRHAGAACEDDCGDEVGEPKLVDPRVISQVGERLELAGTLACPEVARRCLLNSDAMELVDLDPGALAGTSLSREHPALAEPPYERYLDDVRATLLQLLAPGRDPLPQRLFFTAYFADLVHPFFFRGVELFDEGRLAEEIAWIRHPEVLEDLRRRWEGMRFPNLTAMGVVLRIVLERFEHGGSTRLRGLIHQVLQSYLVHPPAGPAQDPGESMSAAQVVAGYEARRDHWEAEFGADLDRYFTHYAINYWLKDFYTDSPSLLVHTQNLLVRMVVLRFLLLSHPDLVAVADDPLEARRVVLERSAVTVFSTFSRAIEHDPAFLGECEAALGRANAQTLAHVVLLLRF
jgi:lysine-N-methylase